MATLISKRGRGPFLGWCAHMHAHTNIYVSTVAHTYAYPPTYICVHMHTCAYAYTYTHTACIHPYALRDTSIQRIYIHTHLCIHIRTCTYTRTHMPSHTRTRHIYIYIYVYISSSTKDSKIQSNRFHDRLCLSGYPFGALLPKLS